MPMPQHCIDCDKVAVVLDDAVPYCTRCYKEEKRSENPNYRGGGLSKGSSNVDIYGNMFSLKTNQEC